VPNSIQGPRPPAPAENDQRASADTTTTALPYRIGDSDAECRYPVMIGAGLVIGRAWRWHRDWLVLASDGEHNLRRPPVGIKGLDMAAAHLAREYAAGRIAAVPVATDQTETARPYGPAPLLDPRMPVTPRNIAGARVALAKLTEHRWMPLGGFPGSDNPWYMLCELCEWRGQRYWSHLRGRNGNPPSASRHPSGCIGEDEVRALIPAYQQ
jgi:hypothetical protein